MAAVPGHCLLLPFAPALLAALAGLLLSAEPAAATITVADDNDTTNTGDGVPLREAIQSINSAPDRNADVTANRTGAYGTNDTVLFNIPGPNPHVTSVTGSLTSLDKPVTIDGLSQGDIAGSLPSGALDIQINRGDDHPESSPP
jgi:hypothetical protein